MTRAKKSLGQHFLRSERALKTIIKTAEVKAGDVVLEIGPGQGILTKRLLDAGAQVLAIEKDDQLFESLQGKFGNKIKLVHGDILSFDLEQLNSEYKLVANIPYNITGAILEKFLSAERQPKRIVLLVQREVAKRIVAKDGKGSILSTSVQAYGAPKYIETVKAGSFVPVPRVDSAILLVDGVSKEFFNQFSETEFFELVRMGFKSKRKKLSSNLAKSFDSAKIRKVFEMLNFDPNLRAEDLKITGWRNLAINLL